MSETIKRKKLFLKHINQLGFAATLVHQVATGDVQTNNGKYPVDAEELYEVMAELMLQNVEQLVELIDAGLATDKST